MERSAARVQVLTIFIGLILAACGGSAPSAPTATPSPQGVDNGIVQASETPAPPTASPTPPAMPTASPQPSPTPTVPPMIRVSENTNCREGPAINYLFAGVLTVGSSAEVIGQSDIENYWYISNPDRPGEGCWLWGEYAQVEGNTDVLPLITRAPSPTPGVGFDVYVKRFSDCGWAQMIVFAIVNTGGTRIWSGYVNVENLDSDEVLYNARERHPFSGLDMPDCPPDHGNELWPGEMKYIHVPIDPGVSGISALGTITLCTADHQGGTCLTKYSYFTMP